MKWFTLINVMLCSIQLILSQEYLVDIDGNRYKVIQINDQQWMAENLKTTRYNDGTMIPYVRLGEVWSQLDKDRFPGYSWYNNDKGYKNPYGALYNAFVVETGKVCPLGWEVPSVNDWRQLVDSLGSFLEVGGYFKAIGNIDSLDGLWRQPNLGAVDSLKFSAIPGGFHSTGATFNLKDRSGYFWTSNVGNTHTKARVLDFDKLRINEIGLFNSFGFSIRCVRN